ncbi:hypothetical protein EUGRSUZ_G00051 [Eucalyptus grandis]|uniref:Uncharacterized protein n=2 Tax=Eucalyptus grandis TaxID=71139 RepID=A0ACC3JZF5_EUCGR|nr:hypothetical protein EUGRSUZ_G00051 [Eucalyptus grandis]
MLSFDWFMRIGREGCQWQQLRHMLEGPWQLKCGSGFGGFSSPSQSPGCFAQRKQHSMCTIFPHISLFATKESVFYPYLSSVRVRAREERESDRERQGER